MAEPFIQTNGLTKQYGRVLALDRCTAHVERGEVFGLLGPNGSGKTTLLRLLMGFLQPTSGTAAIDGMDCYEDSVAVHGLVSYLPGEPRLFRRMRGRQVLEFFSNVRPEGDFLRALEIAERLKLDLTRQVAKASTGMRQKLGLTIALSAATSLLILDEPTSSLDPTARREVLSLVRKAREEGRTVLFSSHVLSEVEEVCDRVAVLREGRLVHVQIMSQLRRRHRIRAKLNGQLSQLPDELQKAKTQSVAEGVIQFDTPGELAPLFGWLSGLPLQEVKIEPIGLQAVYDRFHGDDRPQPNEPAQPESAEVDGPLRMEAEHNQAPSSSLPKRRASREPRYHLHGITNRALWTRWFCDGGGLILGCGFVLFSFQWLAVWIVSLLELVRIPNFLKGFMPSWMQSIIPIPVEAMGTELGILAMAYIDPVVLFTITIYAIARGSDSVSGPVDRGTMELLVALPIERVTLFATHACVTALGAAALAASCWLGTYVGLTLVELPTVVRPAGFLPAAINLFAFTFFLAALTSLISSWQRYRRQTIAWIGGFYVVQLIVKIISRAAPSLHPLTYVTFFGAFEPAALACSTKDVAALSLIYDGILLGMGVIAYVAGAVIFCRRDLPAPL